ncbi:MAG: hypothetical protein ABI365_04415 [Lysobacteraceae bacterium]
MNRHRMHYALAVAMLAALALAGCKKSEEAPPPVVATPAPAALPAAAPLAVATAATADVVGIALGSAVGPDKTITTPGDAFKPTDTIYVAVTTKTSDVSATVPGILEARWTFEDGQTVKEDTANVQFNGAGVTDFSINSPKGFPKGKYEVDILLNGAVVQSKGFGVQ